jgi:hypothetical protein
MGGTKIEQLSQLAFRTAILFSILPLFTIASRTLQRTCASELSTLQTTYLW